MKIGARIKDLRIRHGITLKELANKTGLTVSFLSQLERDLTSPSIKSLEKVARSLNTKVGYFFAGEEQKELLFIKKGMGKKSIDIKRKITSEIIASDFLDIKMQPQVFTIGIGGELTKELIYPKGEKFGMVLKGKLELLCDSQNLVLKEGDSIYCAYVQRPHKLTNIGKTEAKFLWIVFATT